MTRRPRFVLVPQHFGSLVYDRRTASYLPFDRETTGILRVCLSRSFEAVLGTGPSEELGARRGLAGMLHGLGFFRLDGRFDAEARDPDPVPPDHLVGPLAVHLEATARCNLACVHCFAGALPRDERPLDLGELDRLFADLARLGSFRLGVTGGEPLLRRDLFELLDLAIGHGLAPSLTTNGLLVDEARARELGARDLVWLNVSLDGATPGTHDAVRGMGTFAATLDRIRILARHARFSIAFTLMRGNTHEVEACVELARGLGAATAVFRPLYPAGTALHHPERMPSFDGYRAALERLAAMGARDPGTAGRQAQAQAPGAFGPSLRAPEAARIQPAGTCGAGTTIASISVGGRVSPCSFLGDGFDVGSLREERFPGLWNGSAGFRRMRGGAGCTGCGGFEGGCRTRALVFAGSVDAPDPWQVRAEEAGWPSASTTLEVELDGSLP